MATKRSLSDGQQGKGRKERKTGEDQIPPNNPSTSDEVQKKSKYWPGKIFNDTIHGHIEIPPVCVKIIDTPQFQRLRFIKQLGGNYFVYPGASHNRFEHSLGVCHLTGQLVSALKARQDLEISDDDVMCLQIAGLCHDLGHGPFSHMFDKRFLPNMKIEEKHESLSVKMFDHMVEKNNLDDEFKKHFREDLDKNKTFIKELIEGRSKNGSHVWSYKGRGKEKSFLYEIVANKRNGIDVDKWDYFARDCHMLGIKNSFDHTRSMTFARVLKVDDELQICFRDKEVENLYEMFHTRNILHRKAYQHPVGNIIEIMISEAMQKADEHIGTPGKGGKLLSITKTLDDMEAYEKLTDSIIDRIICSTDKKLEESRELLMKVKKRQLYKCVGRTRPREKIDEKAVKRGYVKILEKRGSKLESGDIIIDHVYFNYGMKDKNPIDHVHFYKKDDPDKAIEVKKEEVSGMLPERFAEEQFRFYCKLDDNESLKQAKAALTDWCKENHCDQW